MGVSLTSDDPFCEAMCARCRAAKSAVPIDLIWMWRAKCFSGISFFGMAAGLAYRIHSRAADSWGVNAIGIRRIPRMPLDFLRGFSKAEFLGGRLSQLFETHCLSIAKRKVVRSWRDCPEAKTGDSAGWCFKV